MRGGRTHSSGCHLAEEDDERELDHHLHVLVVDAVQLHLLEQVVLLPLGLRRGALLARLAALLEERLEQGHAHLRQERG